MEHHRKAGQRELPEGFFIQDEELPRTGLDRLRPDDELYQHVPENPADWAEYVMAEDGMPKPVTPVHMPFAPPLTVSNCVCIADLSQFVVRDSRRQVVSRIDPAAVSRTEDGRYWAHFMDVARGVDRSGSTGFSPSRLAVVLRRLRVWTGEVEVEPVRPQCRHCVRQMTDLQDNDEHAFVARICTARRDDGGEFLTIRDSQFFACDMREPRDMLTEARADLFDKNKMLLGQERVDRGEAFDIDRHLRDMLNEQEDDPTGIFAGPTDGVKWQ